MEKKEQILILEMRHMLDNDDKCLTLSELKNSEKFQNKTEKDYRNLLSGFYNKYGNSKNLKFLFTVTFLENPNKIINKIVNKQILEDINEKYEIIDLSIYLVYYANTLPEEYYINNAIKKANELLLNKVKKEVEVSSNPMLKKKSMKKIHYNENKNIEKFKHDKDVTRNKQQKSTSIFNFFKKK